MGVCNSFTNINLKFVFDEKYFEKKQIVKDVPVALPLCHLCNFFKFNLKNSEKKLLIYFKAKKTIYTTSSSLTVSDLALKKGEKIYVSAKTQEKKVLNIKACIYCCETYDVILKLAPAVEYEVICAKFLKKKKCCNKKILNLILNDVILDKENEILIKSDDVVYSVFDENKINLLPNPWKIKKNGLNLRGLCYNPSCVSYKQESFINMAYGSFFIDEELCEEHFCRFCNGKLHLKQNYTFLNCAASLKDSISGVVVDSVFSSALSEIRPASMQSYKIEARKILPQI